MGATLAAIRVSRPTKDINKGIVIVPNGSADLLRQTLIVPAIISLIIFLLSTFVLVPLWRRYRNRYSQYLPLDTISNRTSSLRARIFGGAGVFAPSVWTQRLHERLVVAGDTASDGGYDSDAGEELNEVDSSQRRDLESGNGDLTSDRRLSRE